MDAKLYFVQATPFNTGIGEAGVRPIRILTGWAPNQSNPGSLFAYLLGEIKSYFSLNSILPIKDGSSQPRFTDPPWYIKWGAIRADKPGRLAVVSLLGMAASRLPYSIRCKVGDLIFFSFI